MRSSAALAAALIAAVVASSGARADVARHHRRHAHRLAVDSESVPPGYAYGGYGNGPGPGWSDGPYGPPGFGPGYGYIAPGSPDAGFDLGR